MMYANKPMTGATITLKKTPRHVNHKCASNFHRQKVKCVGDAWLLLTKKVKAKQCQLNLKGPQVTDLVCQIQLPVRGSTPIMLSFISRHYCVKLNS